MTWEERMEYRLLERKIAQAKAQQLRPRWKKQSFVAKLNRSKIQMRYAALGALQNNT